MAKSVKEAAKKSWLDKLGLSRKASIEKMKKGSRAEREKEKARQQDLND